MRHPAVQALADAAAARHPGTCCLGVHPLEGGLAATDLTHVFDAVLVSSAFARSVHARTETHTRAVEKEETICPGRRPDALFLLHARARTGGLADRSVANFGSRFAHAFT